MKRFMLAAIAAVVVGVGAGSAEAGHYGRGHYSHGHQSHGYWGGHGHSGHHYYDHGIYGHGNHGHSFYTPSYDFHYDYVPRRVHRHVDVAPYYTPVHVDYSYATHCD